MRTIGAIPDTMSRLPLSCHQARADGSGNTGNPKPAAFVSFFVRYMIPT